MKAKADSCDALSEVGSASKVFASAIIKSGIGKASWSISRALAGTANRGAAMAAGAVFNASGTDQKKLPSRLRNWLGADMIEVAKRKKQQAELVSSLLVSPLTHNADARSWCRVAHWRKPCMSPIESGQVIEPASNSQAMSITLRRGRGRQQHLYEAVSTPQERVYEHSSCYASRSPNPAYFDTSFDTAQTFAGPHQHASVIEECPYASVSYGAYFDSSEACAGWAFQHQSIASVGMSSRSAVHRSTLAMENREGIKNKVSLREEDEEEDEDAFRGMRGVFEEG
jgi:hypothetical protein